MEEDAYHRMADVQAKHWWYEGRRRIIGSMIREMKLPLDAAILEAGCGPGSNLPVLARFGHVFAFEPDAFAAEHARRTYKVDVQPGLLPHEIPFVGSFDMVGAFDVIEHVEADLESLKALAGVLKPGGHALFTIPAHPFLWSRHDEINHHYRRYSNAEFRELLEKAGYRIDFLSYYNMFLFPLIVAVRFIKRTLRITYSSEDRMPNSRLVNKALTALFGSERFLMRLFPLPFGVSIIAVCSKL